MAKLVQMGIQKTTMAFRPSTSRNYTSIFRLFLAFTVFMKLAVSHLTPLMILAYLQFLETNNTSASAMANHLSAIKAKLSMSGISIQAFHDPRIKYFQKAMTLHRPFKVQLIPHGPPNKNQLPRKQAIGINILFINLLKFFLITYNSTCK